MYERLVNALGGEGIATVVIAIIVIAVLVILGYLLLALVRGVTSGGRLGGGRSAAPRVAVLDIVPVDQKRQLVLLRRDEIEHLVLIGGQNDLVVESGISRMPVRTRRVEPSFAETPSAPRAEPATAVPAASASASAATPAARPVEAPQPMRNEPRPAPAQTRAAAPDVSPPLPPRRTEPAMTPSRPQQPATPRPQPAQPAQPRSMATPTLPQRPAAHPIEAAEGPRAQQPAPAVTVASGSPAATEVSTVRSGGASPLPGRPSASPQPDVGAARPEPSATSAAPVAQPAPAAKAEGSMGPLQVKSFATSVQTHRSDKGASFPPLGAAAGAASAAAAATPAAPAAPAAPDTKSVTAVEAKRDEAAADGDIDQLLMAELSKEKIDTPAAPAVADQPEKPGKPGKPAETAARAETSSKPKPAQDRPGMMSLEEEMDALLRDFTLDPPEKR